MKSVKSKLFISYTITIFLILLFLSIISMYFFNLNKDTRSVELLDSTNTQVEDLIASNRNLIIEDIDKYVDLKNQFLFIFQNERLVFSNQSRFKTKEILEEVYYERDHDEDEHRQRKDELYDKYKDYFDDGFIEIDDYVLTVNYFEEFGNEYEIYLGIDERYLEQSIDDVYSTIIVLNIIIFILLTFLGYLLINKTINPLKLILEELKLLQNSSDLSKRLKENRTNDEFEELIDTFNKMLENIENSVENIKQFSSDASHELRTPLTVIQGEIELIKSRDDATKEQMLVVIDKLDNEQKKLQEIIKNFLLLSRLDKEVVKNNKCSLDKVVFESIEQNLQDIENKGLELNLNIEDDLEVNFNEKYLNIVVSNLLTNAVKYTNEGTITLNAKRSNKQVVLEVSDTGLGLSDIDKRKIFERFYRVDKARTTTQNGIGLGLSIVKKICERFEAKIEVDSKLDIGSTFRIAFKA